MRPATVAVCPSPNHANFYAPLEALNPLCRAASQHQPPHFLPTRFREDPKYFTAPGAGWEPLLRYGQTTIQDKILFGSGAFLIGRSPAELLSEFRALPIKPEVMEKWLWRNAARLLNLEDATPRGVAP